MSDPLKVSLLGVPFGLGGKRRGSKLGPSALRLAGAVSQLRSVGLSVEDDGDVIRLQDHDSPVRGEGIGYFEQVAGNLSQLKARVLECVKNGRIPILFGGDHSLSIGSVGAALEVHGEKLGVIWIDAHADLNTPDTSPSLNLHGMPLGLLCGYEYSGSDPTLEAQWSQLRDEFISAGALSVNRCVWIGLRELDEGEANRIVSDACGHAITMHEIDRYSLPSMLDIAFDRLKSNGVAKVWISFDVDVLDPFVAPGTGTSVRGGITYREAHLLAELIQERVAAGEIELAGLDVCEVNPLLDTSNETALIAIEWLTSLFGKRILPGWICGD